MSTLEQHLNRQAERSRNFFWNRIRWDLVCSLLPSAGEAELVDVGAGTGFLGDLLSVRRPEIGYRYIEPIAGLEAGLAERFGTEANLRESDSFGRARWVTLLDVLEHQEEDRAFMAQLAAKMGSGSLLILTVPAMPSLWSGWDTALGHFRRYRKASLLAALPAGQFEVVELSYLFPELLPAGWVRRLRRSDDVTEADALDAEFPDLPGWLNGSLYRLGTATTRARRLWPAGTSLLAVLRRAG
ncbi:MAG TPA: methyltransferase domain-containing protein [Solirubrobacterales bacterium]